MLSSREEINRNVQATIDQRTERWGLKVTAVEIKDVQLPSTIQRAMAKQAEAEREKRAKVLMAQGEFLAAQTLADAAGVLSTEPAALQLRYLQTVLEMAVEKNSTIIFPLPIDLMGPFTSMQRQRNDGNAEAPATPRVAPALIPPGPPSE